LDFHDFDDDRETVLDAAKLVGLVRILNPGIDLETSRKAITLAEKHPEIYVAVGVHPNCSLGWDDLTYQALTELAAHPKVVAIGEIGLDYYRNAVSIDVQKRVFTAQLELAESLGLPVIIHNRKASEDLLPILNKWQRKLEGNNSEIADRPGVLHSFAGDENTARSAMAIGFFIGVTGPVTFSNAKELQHMMSTISLEHLLVETDAPFLTPHPHRGKRNVPGNIPLIAGKIAELHGVDISLVAEKTTENAAHLFRWSEIV